MCTEVQEQVIQSLPDRERADLGSARTPRAAGRRGSTCTVEQDEVSKALAMALALIVPTLATAALTVKPASAVIAARGEFYIEGRGHFSTDEGSLELPTSPRDAYNDTPAPLANDLHWLLIGYKINGADSNVVVSAPQGSTIVQGQVYTGAVGSKTNVPGIRFEGCETEAGQFIVDYIHRTGQSHRRHRLPLRAPLRRHHHRLHRLERPGRLRRTALTGPTPTGSTSAASRPTVAPRPARVTVTNTSGAGRNTTIKAGFTGFGATDFGVSPTQCANGRSLMAQLHLHRHRHRRSMAAQSIASLVIKSEFTGEDIPGLATAATGQVIPLIVQGTGTGKARIELDGEVGNPAANGLKKQVTQTLSVSSTGFSTTRRREPRRQRQHRPRRRSGLQRERQLRPGHVAHRRRRLRQPQRRPHHRRVRRPPTIVARFKVSCGTDRFVLGQVIQAPQGAVASHNITPREITLPGTIVGDQSTTTSITSPTRAAPPPA